MDALGQYPAHGFQRYLQRAHMGLSEGVVRSSVVILGCAGRALLQVSSNLLDL